MTENDKQLLCRDAYCHGVVKEYTEDGPREPPDSIRPGVFSRLFSKDEKLTWHECSLCNTHHPEYDE